VPRNDDELSARRAASDAARASIAAVGNVGGRLARVAAYVPDPAVEPVAVLIAGADAATRQRIRLALTGTEFHVAADADSAVDALSQVRGERVQLCLLDVDMPGGGMAAARRIARECPSTTVVMLADKPDEQDVFEAVRAGARGFLAMNSALDRLPQALRGVLAGEAALPRGLVAKLMVELRDRDERRLGTRPGARLTEREWEVLSLLAREQSTAAIAKHLFVTPVTVRTHVSAVLRKLDVTDRSAAVAAFRARR
jgi:DNA-binding NarL/FixJ family response regulator